jgi:copper chaperone CopZ
MHCASCEFLIGKLALKHPGVLDVASSYATATARIAYDPAQVKEAELPGSSAATATAPGCAASRRRSTKRGSTCCAWCPASPPPRW